MNSRIRELAHEAGLPTYNPEGVPTKLEKFAELLVRECVFISRTSTDGFSAGRLMEEYFGVQE